MHFFIHTRQLGISTLLQTCSHQSHSACYSYKHTQTMTSQNTPPFVSHVYSTFQGHPVNSTNKNDNVTTTTNSVYSPQPDSTTHNDRFKTFKTLTYIYIIRISHSFIGHVWLDCLAANVKGQGHQTQSHNDTIYSKHLKTCIRGYTHLIKDL